MQPLSDDAPESLRQAWCAARHAWRMEQVAVAEQAAMLVIGRPHSVLALSDADVARAEERTNVAFHALFHEYRTALSMMDSATQRTA